MTAYHAKSMDSLSFGLTKDDKLVGKLLYQGWFKFNAVIAAANGSSYQVEPKGFWGTTVEVKDKETVLLKFRMNWNGDIVVQTYFDHIEKGYVFKHRGFFKESFALVNQEGIELLVMKPYLKWRSLNYGYEITTSDSFEAFTEKELLLFTSLHCANYYMSMMTAA
jgi:hypothetical protein